LSRPHLVILSHRPKYLPPGDLRRVQLRHAQEDLTRVTRVVALYAAPMDEA
jgi:hypothetical protein